MILKMIRPFTLLIILGAFFAFAAALHAEDRFSPATEKAIAQFDKLDSEIRYGRTLSEILLRCSYLQDAWIAYLHEAESQEAFLEGMAEIDRCIDNFRSYLNYAGTYVNFFNPGNPRTLFEQSIQTERGEAYLNTFKTGRDLNAEERELLFNEEWTQFQQRSLHEPFELNAETLQSIESRKLYNFALLPDGTVRAALEKPGGKEYHQNEEARVDDLAYPNHTILAGAPHQAVLTAGAFILYREDDKQLMFISNKSGHFVPFYDSLDAFKKRLSEFEVNPDTVIMVPTVNLSDVILSLYHYTQIPLALVHEDAAGLFERAYQKWLVAIGQLDIKLLRELSQGNLTNLTRQAIDKLNQLREEATYMRSAYQLFTHDHTAPPHFHKFVKHFGNLKDAIKHNVDEIIVEEAKRVYRFLQDEGVSLSDYSFLPADEEELYQYIRSEIQSINLLNTKEMLSIDEFHHIKKTVRELGFLFQCLAEDACGYGQYYFIYDAIAWKFFRFNQQLAVIHDEQVGRIMHGEISKREILLTMPPAIKANLTGLLERLGIIPDKLKIEIVEDTVFWLINEAKWWYSMHYWISVHPENKHRNRSGSYDPLPFRLLTKIVNNQYLKQTSEDIFATNRLKQVLRASETARNALIFFHETHDYPSEYDLYINSLKKIIYAVEKNVPYSAREECAVMLDFISDEGTPAHALEKYRCTDQNSFEQTFAKKLSSLLALQQTSIPYALAEEVSENVQALADIMYLYLSLGQKYQKLPTIAYETTLQRLEMILAELSCKLKNPNLKKDVTVSPKINRLAARLLQKWS